MLKRTALLTVIFVLGCAISVFAAQLSCEILFPEENYGVQNHDFGYMNIRFYLTQSEPERFTAEYTVDNWENVFTQKCSVKPNTDFTQKVSLSHLPKGVFELKVRVKDSGGNIVAESEKKLSLIEFYTPQPLDKYSTLGMHTAVQNGIYETDYINYQLKLIELAGIKNTRMGWVLTWEQAEITPDYFSFDYYDSFFIKTLRDMELQNIANIGKTNDKYGGFPHTKQQYDASARYVKKYTELVPNPKVYELWNEPDLGKFFAGDSYAVSYAAMAKNSALALKDADPDAKIATGGVSGGGEWYLPKIIDNNVMPYVNSYSFHPYSDKNIDSILWKKLNGYDVKMRASGHWLHKYITEMGYTTIEGVNAITEDEQADLLTKFYIYGDRFGSKGNVWYQFMDTGAKPTSNEDNYGVVKRLGRRQKLSYGTLAQTTKMLNSAQYLGYIKLSDNIDGHLYLRYGKPLLAAWSVGDPESFSFGKGIYVEDRFGNSVETDGSVDFTAHPLYISGLDDSWFIRAAAAELKERLSAAAENCPELKKLEINLPKSSAAAYALVNSIYAEGEELIDEYDENTDIKTLALTLYDLHGAGEKAALLYAALSDTKVAGTAAGVCKSTLGKINEKKNDEKYATLEFCDKMYSFAKWYSDKGDYIRSAEPFDGQMPLAQAHCMLAEKLCSWAMKMKDTEKLQDNLGILTYSYPSVVNSVSGKTVSVSYTVDNRTGKDIDGIAIVVDENGNQMGEDTAVSVRSGEYSEQELPVVLKDFTDGNHICRIKLLRSGEELASQQLPVEVRPAVSLSLKQCEKNLLELDSVELNVTNMFDDDFSGSVTVTPPDGWEIQKQDFDISVGGGQSQQIEIPVTKKEPVAFNEYVFGFVVKNAEGAVVSTGFKPVDFAITVRTSKELETESFSGSLSGWENAYPSYFSYKNVANDNVGIPADPTDGEKWKSSNLSGRAFTKWDSNYLYVLVDVFDNAHHQIFTGSNMWMGDSVQFGIDPLANGGSGYQDDDFEYAFCYSTAKGPEAYCGSGKTTGECPPSWVKVVRDNSENITRYLIKMPKSALGEMTLSEKYRFGFNVAVNDSDILQRERYVQITSGVANGKMPKYYFNFTLVPDEKQTAKPAQWSALKTEIKNELNY